MPTNINSFSNIIFYFLEAQPTKKFGSPFICNFHLSIIKNVQMKDHTFADAHNENDDGKTWNENSKCY
jgi:hypothetical protein